MDATLGALKAHWLVRETIGYLRRAFSRLDVTSRSLFALIDEGSCFAGSLMELALACDRIYHLALPGGKNRAPEVALSQANFVGYPMASGQSRLGRRSTTKPALEALKANIGRPLDAEAAFALGLATSIPDDIDWADEIRIAVEERASLSPDALTALEANLRFDGPETLATRVFGRLTAWQNWNFQRPNAVGEKGRAQGLWQGRKGGIRLGPGVMEAAQKRGGGGKKGSDGAVSHGHRAAPDRPRNLHPLQHLQIDLSGRRDLA